MAALLAACGAPEAADPASAEAEPTDAAETAAEAGPVAVIETYYDAIAHLDYQTAWQLWGKDPETETEAYEAFARSFGNTELTTVETGTPRVLRAEGGFERVEIPVRVEDLMSDGTGRSYDGVYMLTRPVTGEDRQWFIANGDLDIAAGPPESVPDGG